MRGYVDISTELDKGGWREMCFSLYPIPQLRYKNTLASICFQVKSLYNYLKINIDGLINIYTYQIVHNAYNMPKEGDSAESSLYLTWPFILKK